MQQLITVGLTVDIFGGHEGVVLHFRDISGRPDQYRFEMIRFVDSRHETVDEPLQ